MRSLVFEGKSWGKYEGLRNSNSKLHKKLIQILKELIRDDPKVGLGKPEPLVGPLAGKWSRRISPKDRVIYSFDRSAVYIHAIGGHYDDH